MKYEKILHITTLTLAYLPTLIFQGQETITVNRVSAGLSQGGSIIYLEGEKNSRESEKNSRQSEKILACEQKFSEYEKILSSLNKNFHESEKILASLKKFLQV